MLCLEAYEKTTEETDLLTRSSKKVKIGDNTESSGAKGGNSYLDSLMGDSFVEPEHDEDSHGIGEVSEDDEDDSEDDECPVIRLSAEEKKRIRTPWQQTIIIKLMREGWGICFSCKD